MRPEIRSAASVLDTSIETLDMARIDQEIGHLAAQNERLLKSVDILLNLHESEKAQRQSLQATLDRLLEEVRTSTQARPIETVGAELRSGVSEDLKPLLHAIVELLELSARRGSARVEGTPDTNETMEAPTARETIAEQDAASTQVPPEDLPGALPDILTKSVEELVGKHRADQVKTLKFKRAKPDGNSTRAETEGQRRLAWIPVTSGASKP